MLKRSFAIGISILFLTNTAAFAESPQYFSDVPPETSHYLAITNLKDEGILIGFSDGSFRTDQPITRAETLKITFTAFNIEKLAENQTIPFKDVRKKTWYSKYVNQAYALGIVHGYPDMRFRPLEEINRAEALKIALKSFAHKFPSNIKLEEPTEEAFNDSPVAAWFSTYMKEAKERNLLPYGNKNMIYPEKIVTRGEFAELIYRLLKSKENIRFGTASYYSDYFDGKGTSSGEIFDQEKLTAAHRELPFGTHLSVTNLKNGKNIEVMINDRGPFTVGLDLDLSKSAFQALAPLGTGVIEIEYELIP